MIFYASFAFQAALIVEKIKWPFRVTAIIVILFSMISTIGGQHRSDTDKIEALETKKKMETLDLLKAEELQLTESLESTKAELDDNTKSLRQFKKEEMESKEYKNLFWKSYTLREARKKYETELKGKREEIKKYMAKEEITQAEKTEDTFYSWLAKFLPFGASFLEFCLYLFPALFFDIISPLGLHVALNIKKEEK